MSQKLSELPFSAQKESLQRISHNFALCTGCRRNQRSEGLIAFEGLNEFKRFIERFKNKKQKSFQLEKSFEMSAVVAQELAQTQFRVTPPFEQHRRK